MTISVCIPTLTRYDLLNELISSLQTGTMKPDFIYVIDNGGNYMLDENVSFTDRFGIQHRYWKPPQGNLGVAGSWNWFITHVSEMRVITNDDVVFAPDALERWIAAYDPEQIICPDSLRGSNAFSAFSIPDGVVAKVGLFDETISPNWAYMEDGDYAYRMKLQGMELGSAPDVLLRHGLSSTLKSFTPEEMREHHERFRLAQKNYIDKWNNLPGYETFTIPYNGVRPDTAVLLQDVSRENRL